jgi:hypothetical protein
MKRFVTYRASVHGKTYIGDSDTLENAIAVGINGGCKNPGCECEKYIIWDRKLKTDDIGLMFADTHKKAKKWHLRGNKG